MCLIRQLISSFVSLSLLGSLGDQNTLAFFETLEIFVDGILFSFAFFESWRAKFHALIVDFYRD